MKITKLRTTIVVRAFLQAVPAAVGAATGVSFVIAGSFWGQRLDRNRRVTLLFPPRKQLTPLWKGRFLACRAKING